MPTPSPSIKESIYQSPAVSPLCGTEHMAITKKTKHLHAYAQITLLFLRFGAEDPKGPLDLDPLLSGKAVFSEHCLARNRFGTGTKPYVSSQ